MNTVTAIFKTHVILSGGVKFNILAKSDHCHAGKDVYLCINLFLQSFASVMKHFFSRKLDISKSVFFFTYCDEMLDFVNFKMGVLVFLSHPGCNVWNFCIQFDC